MQVHYLLKKIKYILKVGNDEIVNAVKKRSVH